MYANNFFSFNQDKIKGFVVDFYSYFHLNQTNRAHVFM